MRLPIRSERDAFLVAYGFAFITGLSVLVGYLVHPLAGIVLFTLIAGAGLAFELRTPPAERASPLRDAQRTGGSRPGRERRALVLADETLADEAWEKLIDEHGRPGPVEVLAPVLQSRTHFVMTDVDRETDEAQQRLEASIAAARRHGLDAAGAVGDPIDPFASLVDELTRYDVDDLIVATRAHARDNWVESDMLRRLREQLDVPVTQVVIDPESGTVDVETAVTH